jgi:hypothetical protein
MGERRKLSEQERMWVWPVFRDTLPYDHVMIADTLGAGAAQYTFREPGRYVLHMGRIAFDEDYDDYHKEVLVHELTHVWQGHHAVISWAYMVDSMTCQAPPILHALVTRGTPLKGARNAAYDYQPGKLFQDYNVEQQAYIVENWYRFQRAGDTRADDLWIYIRANIQAGKPRAFRSVQEMNRWDSLHPEDPPALF